jgi:membrane peptidoglycan carboxypeptidase
MSALAKDIERPSPPIPFRDRKGESNRDAFPLILAPAARVEKLAAPIQLGFEDPRAVPIRGNAPRVGPRFSDRQVAFFCALLGVLAVVSHELRYSSAQAEWWAQVAAPLHFELAPGANPTPLSPDEGPYDLRLGYVQLPHEIERLRAAGFQIASQARPSERMVELDRNGLDVIYSEKPQAGLTLLDRTGRTVYSARYPHVVYDRFESIPPVVMAGLLFTEDRELLDGRWNRNPVMDWERLTKAAGLRLLSYAGVDDPTIGGSTLVTQLEKFRHSPGGRTETVLEKARQMASASIRVYRFGVNNEYARRQIALDYLNSLPLAGRSDEGEIVGLGDGLQAWYGEDFDDVNRKLFAVESDPEGSALAFKQALSLVIAARRPSYYLGQSPAALDVLTDSYVRVLSNAGVISPALRDAALEQPLQLTPRRDDRQVAAAHFVEQKDATLARVRLANMLDVDGGLYALDRYDLTAHTTIDEPIQASVTATLSSLKDPAVLRKNNLLGDHLLGSADPGKVIYSFTLYEKSEHGNLMRVNTDSYDQPFDINNGARIDLGSTAKLRTLITYLELVEETRARYVDKTPEELHALEIPEKDRLTAWVVDYLLENPHADLTSTLQAAMQRRYSASPYQMFATGSGMQTFSNFDRADNDRIMTVEHALQNSVNLVFVRLMRELTDHITYRAPSVAAALLENPTHPERGVYLARFADAEGAQYVRRFYRKYAGQAPDAALELALEDARSSPRQIATIVRTARPDAPERVLAGYLAEHARSPQTLSKEDVDQLYDKYSQERFSLSDRGFLAHVHPLELWVLAYLQTHPTASLSQVLDDSTEARQEVYGWLLKSHRRTGQDRRIAQLFEIDAFLEIHDHWQKLGYPFASLTPSLATALGASGDRPGALAELMGVIVNDGVRYPGVMIDDLHFASQTPFETRMTRGVDGERVLSPEIAGVVKNAIVKVVDNGTAIALKSRMAANGVTHVVGGKTGTGDHRIKVFAGPGRLIESRAVNRAATFVFMIDGRFFGNITAFVPGADAANYQFTSSLPVRVLGMLMPALEPLLSQHDEDSTVARESAQSHCDDESTNCDGRNIVAQL